MRARWIGAAVVVAALAALALQTSVVTRTGFLMGDFRAFYCAARVASHGANPYHVGPLRACEAAAGSKRFFEKNPGVTIPAPLPAYAIAALVPLSVLPFAVAAMFWAALLALAWVASIAALARFSGVSWEIALAVFSLSLGVLSLPFGEVVPIAIAFICLAAYCARQGRGVAAALFAAGAMIEPHLGLPACVGLAIWMSSARIPLAAAFAGLGAISLVLIGPAANVEYLTSLLPAHALSEVTRDTQYSLAAVLAAFGAPLEAAVRAGLLWYLAMLAAGVAVGGSLARKTGNDAFIVCAPPAFAVFGGSFIHITQIAAALPAALLLLTATPQARLPALAALLLLAVPWGWAVSPALIVAPAVPVGYLAWRYLNANAIAVFLAGAATAALLVGLGALYAIAAPHLGAHTPPPAIDARLPEASWSAYSRGGSTGSIASWAVRIPTWAGLALLLGLLTHASGLLRRNAASAAVVVATCCTFLPIAGQVYGDRAGGWLMVDFRAYYCAALAQRDGANPYDAQPLGDCERNTPAPYYRAPPNVAVPAPYPPYALALLYPLTLLPFKAAAILWWMLLAGALVLAARALARIAQQPVIVAWAVLALSLGLATFSSGNLMSLALAMLLAATLCVARGRPLLAVPCMALSMIQPQVALPAAIALFIAYPRVRIALAVAAMLLAGISIASGGLDRSFAYITTVLPAHALSEVSRDNQYSLATVLAALGVPDGPAASLGSLSYVVMAALGICAGLRLARRYDRTSLALLVPTAFAVLGGSFVHTAEIAAAVPAALCLYTRATEHRAWLFLALLLLAVPWMLATSLAIFLAPLFPVAYLTYVLWKRQRAYALAAALATLAALALLHALSAAPATSGVAVAHLYPRIDPHLAEASWRQFVLANVTNRPIMWLLRLPTWSGLLALAVPALLLARKPRLALATEMA